jgi:hypothetical protein
MSTPDSLAATIEEQKDHPLAWKTVLKRAVRRPIAYGLFRFRDRSHRASPQASVAADMTGPP